MGLSLDHYARGPADIIEVDGELDVYTASEFRQQLVGIDQDGRNLIVIDLTKCDFLDATGLGVIVGVLKRARARGGHVAIARPQPRILRVFQITGLTKVFPIRADVDEAIAAIAPEGDT